MGREHYDSFWFHLSGNLFADFLKLAVDWMVRIVHDIRLSSFFRDRPEHRKRDRIVSK